MHWTLNQVLIKMTAGFKKSNPSKAVLPSPTGPLSLQMPSFCIKLARRPTNAWQKSWREQATQRLESATKITKRGKYEKYTPKKRQRLVVMHGTTATIRPRPASRNFVAITKFLTRKLIISQILSVSRNFCASKIWSYTVCTESHWFSHAHACAARGRVIALSVSLSVSQSVSGHNNEHFRNVCSIFL